MEGLQAADLEAFTRQAMYPVRDVVRDLKTSDVFEGVFAGEEVFAFVSPLGFGEPALYLATALKSTELGILHELRAKKISVSRSETDLRASRFGSGDLNQAREINESLEQAVAELSTLVTFVPREAFHLDQGAVLPHPS